MMINNNTYKRQNKTDYMPNTLVNLRIPSKLFKEVVTLSSTDGYSNIQDFVRASIREKVKAMKLEHAELEIRKLRGSSKVIPLSKKELSKRIQSELQKRFEK